MKPNTKRLRLWADALLSGKYEQGRGQLKTEYGLYCCLGVACEVHGKRFNGAGGRESVVTSKWYGIDPAYGDVGGLSDIPGQMDADDELTDMNDAEGDDHWTFPQIAGLIYDYCEAADTGAL